jgi:hypothetical protein
VAFVRVADFCSCAFPRTEFALLCYNLTKADICDDNNDVQVVASGMAVPVRIDSHGYARNAFSEEQH